jgi:hypothetical protein
MMVMDELNADIARLKQSLAKAREQLNRSPQTNEQVFSPVSSCEGVCNAGNGAHAGYGKQWIETLKAAIEVIPDPLADVGASRDHPERR